MAIGCSMLYLQCMGTCKCFSDITKAVNEWLNEPAEKTALAILILRGGAFIFIFVYFLPHSGPHGNGAVSLEMESI